MLGMGITLQISTPTLASSSNKHEYYDGLVGPLERKRGAGEV